MKKAFSSLGCPGWSFKEIFATAKDLGMDGIELRGLGTQMYAPNMDIFSRENLADTLAAMNKAGLAFSMLTSGCDLSDDIHWDAMLQEAKDYIDLAKKIGSNYVRILCESTPDQHKDLDLTEIAAKYRCICDYADGSGVYPLIETNSALANSDTMKLFLKQVDRANAFVLWDVHHPHRYFHEDPYKTAANLKGLVKYVHVKDSVMHEGKTQYRMMGYGDVPVFDCLKALKENGYDGYVSLEWVKRWCLDLQEAGIVFSHYANYMQNLEAQLNTAR